MRPFSQTIIQALLGAVPLTLVAGCESYRPQPITAQRVAASLATPADDALRVAAASLKNPLLPPISLDVTDGLTPDEAAVVAVLVNPTLRAARSAALLADAQVFQAGLLPDPALTGSIEPPVFGNTDNTFVQWTAGLAWDVQQLITRSARVRAARFAQAQVRLDVAWQEWQTAVAARQAVRDLAAYRAQQAVAVEIADRLQGYVGDSKSAVDRGDVTITDFAAAQTAARDARLRVAGIDRQVAQQRITLNATLGLPPEADIILQEPPAATTRPADDVPEMMSLSANLENRRLDLVALRRGYDSQEAAVRAAILGQFPAVNLGILAARDTGKVGTLGPAVTIGLPIFDRNRGQIALERATRQRLFDEYVARLFTARSDLAAALAEVAMIAQQITAAARSVDSLTTLVSAYRAAGRERDIDAFTLYLAENDLAQKRIDLLELRRTQLAARAAVELAAGVFLPDAPAPTTQPTTREATQ